ncbi:Transposase [Desulfosporosinus sp. I2]|uniref:IS110 family transposase n=1 Tax=Desulfosporosinus sp. I2 TaxID=1617025 RepID=UPI0005EED72E|nr:transposase [Desulfosporosinus sp. I2]KJR44337.1 Transposase [Desulfosporosinus sp. I2]
MIDVPVLSIDVSKSKSVAALFKSYHESVNKPFPFYHTPKDMSRLKDRLCQLELETGKKPHIMLEATGNYSKPISAYFEEAGYHVPKHQPHTDFVNTPFSEVSASKKYLQIRLRRITCSKIIIIT